MNNVSFPQTTGHPGGFTGILQQNVVQPENNLQGQALDRQIYASLSKQTPSTGWQAQISPQQRLNLIKQLISSLRLIKPPKPLGETVDIAIRFEHKLFESSPDSTTYQHEFSEKLHKIQETRQKQAAEMQSQAHNMHNPMQQTPSSQGQNMSFPPQLQHQMQASPIPAMQQQHGMNMKQQMGMGMGMNLDGSMGFGGNHLQANMQPQQPQPGFPQPQRPRPNPANPNANVDNFTAQDHERINTIAANIAARTSDENKQKIRESLRRNNPAFAQNGRDPLGYFFKTSAQKQYRQMKMQSLQGGEGGNNGVMNSMQFQPPQRPGTAQMGNAQSMPQPGMMTNLNHFQGKQADGLRSQEAGQLVVPASGTPNMSNQQQQQQQQQQMMRNPQFGQGNNARPMGNPGMLSQQPQNLQQMQQVQQLQQIQQMQQRQQNLGGSQFQNQGMSGNVPGGRAPVNFQGMPGQPNHNQPNAPMSMLNRPVGAQMPGTPNQAASHPRPMAQTPVQNAQAGTQPMPNAQTPQIRPPFGNLPPEVQRLLQNSKRENWAEIIQRYKQHQAQRMATQAPNMQQTASQPGNMRQGPGGRFPVENGMGTEPMQQSLSAGPTTNQGVNPQMLAEQQQQLRQQHQAEMLRRRQEQNANTPQMPLNERELAFIDNQDIPGQVFSQMPTVPRDLAKWKDLKQYLASHPDNPVPIERINQFQTLHFRRLAQIQNQRNHQRQMPIAQISQGQNGQAAHGQRPPDQPQTSGQNAQNMPMAPNGNFRFNPQLLQQLRSKYPTLAGKSDMELSVILRQQQANQLKNRSQQQRQGAPMPGLIPQTQQQAPPQRPDQVAQRQQMNQTPTSTANVEQQRHPPQVSGQRPQSGPVSAQPTERRVGVTATQATPNQPAAKNLKRPNNDATETGNAPQPPAQNAPSQPNLGPGKPTHEQWNNMSSEEQQKFLRLRNSHNQGMQERMGRLMKEAAASMPRPVPVQMTAEERMQIATKLTEGGFKNFLTRMNGMMYQYLTMTQDEGGLKELIKQKQHITLQYKDQNNGQKFEPIERFTISFAQLQQYQGSIMSRFQKVASVFQKSAQNQNQNQAQGQPQAQPRTQGPTLPQTSGQHQLTPANLQQLQEQQQEAQKAKRASNNVPAAPTTHQPPQQLGATSPHTGHGAPIYGGPGMQAELKLPPDPKRRKKNTQAATSTAPTNRPSSSPQISKKAEERSFKCLAEDCEFRKKGFTSQAELDTHTADAHKKEEHIEDPMAYLMENARTALGLDEQGQPLKKPKLQESKPPQATPLQKTASKQGSSSAMSRETSKTGTGLKPVSPAISNIKGLPQPSKAGTSAPLTKDKENAENVLAETHGPQNNTPAPDPWNDSPLSLGALQETFGDFNMDSNFSNDTSLDNNFENEMSVDDMMEAYISTEAWTKIQEPKNTPDGSSDQTRSSPAENSDAHNSDISKGDDLFINIDPNVPLTDTWLNFDVNGDDIQLNQEDSPPIFTDFELDKLNVDEEHDWKDINWDVVVAETQEKEKAQQEKEKADRAKKRVRR
ncbi:MAG: hypothetical protein Q9160_007223 [Pyrenula sp. 1 TL-2023]